MFAKLSNLGFGGKTLSLIQSMYRNDSLRFLINGKYSDELWLTQGVKQGQTPHTLLITKQSFVNRMQSFPIILCIVYQ